MSTSAVQPPIRTRGLARFALATMAALSAVAVLPLLLVAIAVQRFGHASPLHGVKVPWQWSFDDLRSWGGRLTDGLDSTAALVDLFLRLALVVGWVCAVVLMYTVAAEVAYQLRHGMPSAQHRRVVGLGALGRKLATVLVAVLPLAVSATPALAGPSMPRAAIGVVVERAPVLSGPEAVVVALPLVDAPVPMSARGSGWSLVEVKRGDSIWAIAERVAGGREIAAVAKQIVAANLGTVMGDGHRFSTPALIEPGWLLNVPDAAVPTATVATIQPPQDLIATGDDYVVVAGDSYWKIAEHHLDPSANASEVAHLTSDLMVRNAPLLGYSDQRLIRPGDIVRFGPDVADVDVVAVVPVVSDIDLADPIEAPPIELPPIVTDSMPPVVVDIPTAVVALPTTVPPAVDSEPAVLSIDAVAAPVFDHLSNDAIPMREGLAAAALLVGGALVVLDARRRQQLRSAEVGARLVAPTEQSVETEMLLRSLSSADQLVRIDLALRSAAHDLVIQQSRALAIEIADDGEIRLYTDCPAPLVADHWIADVDTGEWHLPAQVSLADLAAGARRSNQPCPALIHIGESAGGRLFVDLEALGVLSIDASPEVAASIVRCAAASMAVSPFVDSSRVFTVGLEPEARLGSPSVEPQASLGDAIEAVRSTLGSIAAATSGITTTFALRAVGQSGEAWEPSLLLAVGADDPEDLAQLATLARGGGRGVGVMIDRPVVGSGAVLRATAGDFVLEPLGRRVNPVGLSAAEVNAIDELLDASDRQLVAVVGDVVPLVRSATTTFSDRPRALIVQVLGHVSVQTIDGQPVAFDRSKAQELVVWLSQHRRRPKRASARTALWDVAVRDATFSNVVSDARRAMAKMAAPPPGQEWLGRTMNEDLPLHDLVVSDSELLADRVAAAAGLEARAAIAVLRPGVELIHGMPFAGTSYLWPDAEGITSALVLLATSAAADLAAHYLAVGDIEGVFWSTGQGLKVLAGHEELIALRMRAHAYRGDLSGVRNEWDSYERAVSADTWASAEPSPKLIELRRELLAPSLAS